MMAETAALVNQNKEVRQQNTTKMKNSYERSLFDMQDRVQQMKSELEKITLKSGTK
jgi:uncharacterized membrane-anchored protein YjiN (DUF445 family)